MKKKNVPSSELARLCKDLCRSWELKAPALNVCGPGISLEMLSLRERKEIEEGERIGKEGEKDRIWKDLVYVNLPTCDWTPSVC